MPKTEEEKRDDFQRLSSKRVESLEHDIKLLGNLSTSAYRWTPAEVDVLFRRLATAMRESYARYQERGGWPEKPAAPKSEANGPDVKVMQETIDLQKKVIDTMQVRLIDYRNRLGLKSGLRE